MRLKTLLAILALTACTDDITDSVIPEYDVHYSCNMMTINAVLQQTKQTSLDSPGGYVRVYDKQHIMASDIVGAGGLLILQNFEGLFYAFDLACPYCFSQNKKIKRIDLKDGIVAHCATCESEFSAVFYGSPAPSAGPANTDKLILRQYHARRSGDGTTIVVSR